MYIFIYSFIELKDKLLLTNDSETCINSNNMNVETIFIIYYYYYYYYLKFMENEEK